MKAIILTCDKYLPFADHTIYSYEKNWKSNPFIFRVPYGEIYPEEIRSKYGDKVDIIQTDAAKVVHECNQVDTDSDGKVKVSLIKNTVLDLIEDIADDEWIFWTMDDRYLIDINEKQVKKID